MDIFKASERLMAMDERTWARHANPWSAYTRFSCLPLLVCAIWSRVWLGWWCLVPIALALAWMWINPRLFAPPARLDSWAARGVMGERLFLARKERAIPKHHERMAYLLTGASAVGAPILAYGMIVFDFWATLCGMVLAMGAKLWFVDRMVWLYDDMEREGGTLPRPR